MRSQLPAGLCVLGAYVGTAEGLDAAAAAEGRRACETDCAALGAAWALFAVVPADGLPSFYAPSGEAMTAAALPDTWVTDTLAVLRCRVRAHPPVLADVAFAHRGRC